MKDTRPSAAAAAAAEAEREDPVAALLLLAGLVEDGLPGSVPHGTKTAARKSRSGNSSGGSADTQSKLPGSSAAADSGADVQARPRRAQRARRPAAKRRRQSDDDEDYMGEEDADTDSEGETTEDEADGGSAEAAGGAAEPRRRKLPAAAAAAGEGGDSGAAAVAAAGEEDEEAAGEGDGVAPRKRTPKPPKPLGAMGVRKYVSSQITISILEQEGCFNMTQVDAARHLGFGSSTVLKKVMRRLGIKQWPYRKRTSAKKITCSLEEYMRKYGDPAKVDAVLERVRMELAVYEASPTGSIPLRPELAALRQRLYKLDNKVKHEFKKDQEAPLRQCVHSLVEKTWQELQPSWMSDLARQSPLMQPMAEGGGGLPPLPTAAEGGGAAEPFDAAQAVMLAMLMQGLVPQGLGAAAAGGAAISDLSAATQEQQPGVGVGGEPTPTTQQLHGPAASPEEAAAMVAALAPDHPAPQQQAQAQQAGQGTAKADNGMAAAAAGEAQHEQQQQQQVVKEEEGKEGAVDHAVLAAARVAALAPEPAGDKPAAGKEKEGKKEGGRASKASKA